MGRYCPFGRVETLRGVHQDMWQNRGFCHNVLQYIAIARAKSRLILVHVLHLQELMHDGDKSKSTKPQYVLQVGPDILRSSSFLTDRIKAGIVILSNLSMRSFFEDVFCECRTSTFENACERFFNFD